MRFPSLWLWGDFVKVSTGERGNCLAITAPCAANVRLSQGTVSRWTRDNNQEIASQIGTVRELVSRNLSRLQAEGLIEIDGRRLTIRDFKAIEAEVNSVE